MKRTLFTILAAGVMMLSTISVASAAPSDRASEVGHCSVVYGKLQLRDDVARYIANEVSPPGTFYSESAKNKGGAAC
jgi:hypothetical protein